MTRTQLSDEEIAKKYSRPRLNRGPKTGYLKRTRPTDASSIHQAGADTAYLKVVQANEEKRCAAKACHRGRFGMSRWCLEHRATQHRTGDPLGRTIGPVEWRAFAHPSYRVVRQQLRKGHPSVVAAIHWVERELTLAERLETGSASAGHVDEATSVYLAWLLPTAQGPPLSTSCPGSWPPISVTTGGPTNQARASHPTLTSISRPLAWS